MKKLFVFILMFTPLTLLANPGAYLGYEEECAHETASMQPHCKEWCMKHKAYLHDQEYLFMLGDEAEPDPGDMPAECPIGGGVFATVLMGLGYAFCRRQKKD